MVNRNPNTVRTEDKTVKDSEKANPDKENTNNGTNILNDDTENETPNRSVSQTAISDSNIKGDVSIDNFTQIGYQTVVNKFNREVNFFEPDLKLFSPPTFQSPQITSKLLTTLEQQNFLVLGDGINVDKSTLARHVAALMAIQLQPRGKKVVTKEWYISSDSGSIQYEVEESELRKILILNQAAPQNFLSYTLPKLQQAIAQKRHFVIVTTDLPFAAWRLPDSCQSWWHDLTENDVSDNDKLINQLSHEDALNTWYYNQLNQREQLLAISLSFFDGLFDDQFFAAIEILVTNVWKNRDANLKALDYCDLDNLRSYFEFIDTDDQKTLVKLRFPKQRFTCLKIAWKSHRRQILAALPVLVY
ncbi:hypothetical protein QGP82_09810 [Leptothoe sp. LEGE 181152]|nr:hypothetical protein [Leptothoe sp. LEGE 181152]